MRSTAGAEDSGATRFAKTGFPPAKVGEVDVTDAASLAKAIGELEKQMKTAAKRLEFEEAAQLRDRIKELRAQRIYKA